MKSLTKLGVLASSIGMALSVQAGELPNSEAMSGLQFNFSPPGARSLGMGGAFIGRADDATAAFANPAGLSNLFSPEISAEYRSVDYTTTYTSGGAYPDVDRSTASSDTNNLSYLSYVHPRENWVFALYRQQVMDFNTAFSADSVTLAGGSRYLATTNAADLDIVSYGFSLAYRLNDRVALGANVSYYDYSGDIVTGRLQEGMTTSNQIQGGSDNDTGFNVGLLFKATDRLSIGLVYRSSAKFANTHQNIDVVENEVDFARNFDFEVPDMYGIGFSFQPNDNLTLNLDINRINYSKIADPVFWMFTADPGSEFTSLMDKISIDDGTEIRLGGEYVFSNKPIAIRAGIWNDPDHTLKHDGDVLEDGSLPAIFDQAHFSFFQGGDDEIHYALGFGVFWDRFQLDVAADFSDIQDTISVSGVFRF